MYLGGTWYDLKLKAGVRPDDPVKGLDVSVLQEKFLAPVLGIGDPRTDKRIDFVGGIRGVKELERRCEADRISGDRNGTAVVEPPVSQKPDITGEKGILLWERLF